MEKTISKQTPNNVDVDLDLANLLNMPESGGNSYYSGQVEKVELIKWVPSFCSGIKKVDDQHKELVNLINNMFNHSSGDAKKEREYFTSIVHQLIEYVKLHFQTEEKLMIATKFPDYHEHKAEHDSFTLHVISVVKNYTGNNRLTLLDITKFLKDWVLSHVAVMDQKYFVYFRKIAVRGADGKLKITRESVANMR